MPQRHLRCKLPLVIHVSAHRLLLLLSPAGSIVGNGRWWRDPIDENRMLRRQLGGRRPRLTDDDRRQLAARAYRLGQQALRFAATIVTPDTLLRWHWQLDRATTTHDPSRVGEFKSDCASASSRYLTAGRGLAKRTRRWNRNTTEERPWHKRHTRVYCF